MNDLYRIVGGRRRYNLQRQEAADRRREAMSAMLSDLHDRGVHVWAKGMTSYLAAAFGVSRTTAWRDFNRILGGPYTCQYYSGGQPLFTVWQVWKGGSVMLIVMPDGHPVFSYREREKIIRRYGLARRGRPWQDPQRLVDSEA